VTDQAFQVELRRDDFAMKSGRGQSERCGADGATILFGRHW